MNSSFLDLDDHQLAIAVGEWAVTATRCREMGQPDAPTFEVHAAEARTELARRRRATDTGGT